MGLCCRKTKYNVRLCNDSKIWSLFSEGNILGKTAFAILKCLLAEPYLLSGHQLFSLLELVKRPICKIPNVRAPPSSHVEIPNLIAVVLGRGPSGGNWVIRVGPSYMGSELLGIPGISFALILPSQATAGGWQSAALDGGSHRNPTMLTPWSVL